GGYRFVAPVTVVESALEPAVSPVPVPALAMPTAPVSAPTSAPNLVGREAEVTTLRQWFAKALQGERHLGFITGEAGIGKTTLVDTFVTQLAAQVPVWIGHGQCIEQYGAGEAYLPLSFMQRPPLLLFLPSEDSRSTRAPSVSSSESHKGCAVTSPATPPSGRTTDSGWRGGVAPARSVPSP